MQKIDFIKPLEIRRTFNLSLSRCKDLTDLMLDQVQQALKTLPGVSSISIRPWQEIPAGNRPIEMAIQAGRVFRAAIQLDPVSENQTIVMVLVSGTYLMISRETVERLVLKAMETIGK